MHYRFSEGVLIIFTKAPITGQVKTRLQPDLSSDEAVAVYVDLTQMTLDRAFSSALCPVQLHCSPNSDHPFFRQCALDYPLTLHDQHGGNLGERMLSALTKALSHYRYTLLIGCDCPSLTATDISEAFQALQAGNDVVIAPADDGGYVLIGMKQPHEILFTNITWGNSEVMSQTRTLANLAGLRLHELRSQWDVDTVEDWRRWINNRNCDLTAC